MKTSHALLGILSGIAVGTVIGVLFAPDKGSETRKKIIKKSTDTADDLKEKTYQILSFFSRKQNWLTNKGRKSITRMTDVQIENIKSINKQLRN